MQKSLYFLEISFAAVLFPLELSPSHATRKDNVLIGDNFSSQTSNYRSEARKTCESSIKAFYFSFDAGSQ
jgi:hypothetical protein